MTMTMQQAEMIVSDPTGIRRSRIRQAQELLGIEVSVPPTLTELLQAGTEGPNAQRYAEIHMAVAEAKNKVARIAKELVADDTNLVHEIDAVLEDL